MFEQENRRIIKQENIPNTKSRHLIIMNNLKKKEENWNNRFYVQGNQVKNESLEKNRGIQTLMNKLLDVQNQHQIPEFHRELFTLCIKSIPKPAQSIQFEIEEMQNRKSHIQLCMQAVETREKCLLSLFDNISQIHESKENQQYIQKSAELITHLRILSINVVEQVIQWRQYLMKFLINIHSNQSIQLPYLYYRENYLFKMKRDVLNVQNSILQNYYQFSNKSDPFFVSITKPAEDSTKIVQYVSKPLFKRIKYCEQILTEEHSFVKDDSRSLHKQQNSRDSIKNQNSPEKVVFKAGRIRPKRQNQSQNKGINRDQQIIPQLDIIDFTEHKMSSPPKPPPSQKKENILPSENRISSAKKVSHQKEAIQNAIKEGNKIIQQNTAPTQIQEKAKTITQQDDQKPINTEFRIEKCQITDDKIESYLQSIPEDVRKSNRTDYQQMKSTYQQQNDSFCLAILEDKLLGLAQCYLDSQLTSERKIIINHFSTLIYDQYSDLLIKLLEQIWINDACMEIRILMYHYTQNDKFEANKDIATKLKQIGFKWKVVQSVNSEIRFTVMAIRRPNDIQAPISYDPLFLQHMYITAKPTFQNGTKQFTSFTCLCNLIKAQVTLNNEYLITCSQKLDEQEYYYKGIQQQEQTKEEYQEYVQKYYEGYQEVISHQQCEFNDKIISSFAKECYRWKQQRIAQKNRQLFNLYKKTDKEDNATAFLFQSDEGINIYLLNTDQANISIFVFEYDKEITQEAIQKIFQSCQSQTPISTNLYVPQFVSKIKTKIQDDIVGIGRFSTLYKPKYVDIEQVDDSQVVIKPPFVFGIIAEDFNDITNLPQLILRVEEEDIALL